MQPQVERIAQRAGVPAASTGINQQSACFMYPSFYQLKKFFCRNIFNSTTDILLFHS